MKKVNRILMATVAILLSLVLISTCLVSGTLAKFAIIKDATTEVSFKRFGVTMQVKRGSTVVSDNDANSVDIVYSPSIELYPGVSEKNSILFAFDGALNVPAILTVRVDVELSDKFFLPTGDTSYDTDTLVDFSGSSTFSTGKAYMPLAFYVGTVDDITKNALGTGDKLKSVAAWKSADTVESLETVLESAIVEHVKALIGTQNDVQNDSNGYYVTKDLALNSQVTPGIGFGFEWTMGGEYVSTSTSNNEKNAVSTWLANQFTATDKPITIKVTVSLEQDIS